MVCAVVATRAGSASGGRRAGHRHWGDAARGAVTYIAPRPLRPNPGMRDQCYRSVTAKYGKWSARAAQAVSKCRKKHGHVRKSAAGASLRRWAAERWVDKRTNKPCGAAGSAAEYCRPTRRISKATPAMPRGNALKAAIRTKVRTNRAKPIRRLR